MARPNTSVQNNHALHIRHGHLYVTFLVIEVLLELINAPVDTQVPHDAHFLCQLTIMLIVRLAAIVINAPLALVFGVAVGLSGIFLASAYMRAQMPVTRETSKVKAPVLAQ